MRRLVYVVLLAALVLMPTKALDASGFWRHGYSAMSETNDFKNAGGTKLMSHQVTSRWKGTELTVHLNVTEGEAVASLIDPTGSTRWEKNVRGDFSFNKQFDGKSGVWRVELRFKGATGHYSVKLVDY
jgi:hypothetical protein